MPPWRRLCYSSRHFQNLVSNRAGDAQQMVAKHTPGSDGRQEGASSQVCFVWLEILPNLWEPRSRLLLPGCRRWGGGPRGLHPRTVPAKLLSESGQQRGGDKGQRAWQRPARGSPRRGAEGRAPSSHPRAAAPQAAASCPRRGWAAGPVTWRGARRRRGGGARGSLKERRRSRERRLSGRRRRPGSAAETRGARPLWVPV